MTAGFQSPCTISIHASAKEATRVPLKLLSELHFNPRLREGGDVADADTIYRVIEISIHASAKEATSGAMTPIYYWRISIHASAKEATIPDEYMTCTVSISIHASAKEATLSQSSQPTNYEISIHASAKEATATYCDTSAIMYISSLNNFFVRYF